MPVMERLLQQYPDADVLMALNDPGAFSGIADRGKRRSIWNRWVAAMKTKRNLINVASVMFAFVRYEIVEQFTNGITFGAYLDYYTPDDPELLCRHGEPDGLPEYFAVSSLYDPAV
jgi:hypothetical protein